MPNQKSSPITAVAAQASAAGYKKAKAPDTDADGFETVVRRSRPERPKQTTTRRRKSAPQAKTGSGSKGLPGRKDPKGAKGPRGGPNNKKASDGNAGEGGGKQSPPKAKPPNRRYQGGGKGKKGGGERAPKPKKEPLKAPEKESYVAPMRVRGLSYATVARSSSQAASEKGITARLTTPPAPAPVTTTTAAEGAKQSQKKRGTVVPYIPAEVITRITKAIAKGGTKAVGEAPEIERIDPLASRVAEPSAKVSPSSEQIVSRLFSTLQKVDQFVASTELNTPCSEWVEHQKSLVLKALSASCCQVEAALGQKDLFRLPGWSLFKEGYLTVTTAPIPDILSGVEPLVSKRYKRWLNELGLSSFEVHFDPADKRHKIKLFLRQSFLKAV
ncbi:hypothetical protein TWF481_009285 [Arthrobotrys musiformis]|uniref:Uncharacterized protein n=1 Tax=Arthrobotrys musiformis TaxID=47236 RepID=A0AAV9W5G1_9PEZI